VSLLVGDLSFRVPIDADVSTARQLLSAAGLPIEDVTVERLALLAERNGDVVGLIGLEQFIKIGLLRSLIVSPAHRSGGVGKALVSALEKMAMEKGVSELWLLTIDADAWFAQLGYRAREREAAPPAIKQTDEFSSLCPGDAVLMRKNLRD
jgi:amino-acid N-acetyltransferase